MRDTCLDCVIKHLSQAEILLEESLLGHPDHLYLAIGHLAEAESECLLEYPELAVNIRENRYIIMETEGTQFDYIKLLHTVLNLMEMNIQKHSKNIQDTKKHGNTLLHTNSLQECEDCNLPF